MKISLVSNDAFESKKDFMVNGFGQVGNDGKINRGMEEILEVVKKNPFNFSLPI